MVYKLYLGIEGRLWFVGDTVNDIWVWDRRNQKGIMGDEKTFQVGSSPSEAFKVKGPWASNPKALFEETGITKGAV